MSLKTNLPEVFNAPSVAKHNVVYAETRRPDENSLEGNLSEQDYAGDIPLVISQKNYERYGSELSFEDWAAETQRNAHGLDATIESQLGFKAIAYMRVVHGIELADLDATMDENRMTVPYAKRPAADATFVTKLGYASCIPPADCAISNIVDPKSGALMQIHTGYVGIQKGTIASALKEAEVLVDPKRSVVYIAPHAQEGYVINQVNDVLYDKFMADPFMAQFVTRHKDGKATLSLTDATVARLVEAGFLERNIEISPDNTLTDPTLYSQSEFLTHGVNGRFGVILGKSVL